MIDVTLTQMEAFMGALVGMARHFASATAGHKETVDTSGDFDSLARHVLGACGEIAVAKVMGRYWSGHVNQFKRGGDIGDNVQVRARRRHDYDLVVREADNDNQYYVLVTGVPPHLKVWGYILGGDAKRPEFRKNYGGFKESWFVPSSHLTELPTRFGKVA